MFPNHYMDVRVGAGNNSVAYFSRQPKAQLILFVHGFSGHATRTWDSMHQLLPAEAAVAHTDLIFYGYESTARAQLSADILRQFLSDLNNPNGRFQTQIPSARSQQFPHAAYKKILIVAHSLGAALARRATLDAMKANETWVAKTKLVLFAPAHRGAYLAELASELKGTAKLLTALAAFVKLRVPVLEDLASRSGFVTDLETETSVACKKRPRPPLKAECVVFGLRDSVVQPKPFCSDPNSNVWPGHGHMSVCKVSVSFRDPLTEILRYA